MHGDGPALGLGCDLLDFGAAELQIVVLCEKGGNLVWLEGEMPLVEGEHLPARLPASQTRNLQRIAGRQQEMDAVRRAVDEPIEDVQGLGVAVENVGVVQCQEQRLAVGDVQRVDQQIDRRRPWGRPLCPGLVPRVQPGQRCFRQVGQRLAQAVQQMQQEHQRIGAVAVELVPREGMAQPGRRCQRCGFAIACAGLQEGDAVIQRLGQRAGQSRTMQDAAVGAGWCQAGAHHHGVGVHGLRVAGCRFRSAF